MEFHLLKGPRYKVSTIYCSCAMDCQFANFELPYIISSCFSLYVTRYIQRYRQPYFLFDCAVGCKDCCFEKVIFFLGNHFSDTV